MSEQSALDAILCLDESGVRRITLNRPGAANALRPEDRNRLIALLEEADEDPAVRVVVLAANGKHFCAGADVKALAGRRASAEKRVTDGMRRIMGGAQRLVAAILDCGKPVIAVVQGAATGVGAHLVLAADLVVASDEAALVESFVRRGLVVDGGGAYLLPRRIGMHRAKELAFFGDRLEAAELLTLGIANRVVPAAELESAVCAFTDRLAAAPTSAIALTKKLLNESPDTDRASAFLSEALAQDLQSFSHDSREGVQAFVDHRDPEYRGW